MSGETEQQVSGWTVDTLKEYMQAQIDDMRIMLQERYETQTKAIDAAFIAQQTAMQTALTAAERAVQTASTAAEKAVLKAESATEKRFEAVNEFRAQLADQQGTFMSRELAQTQFTYMQDRIATEDQLVNGLRDRITRLESLKTGASESHQGTQWAIGVVIASFVALISLAGLIAALVVR
jgi:hypothetical protein